MTKYQLRKVLVLGPANAGKTSIAKFISTINKQYALKVSPSTSVEKFRLSIFSFRINVFVTPGQKRFQSKNLEYLSRILDPSTIVLYVIDASERHKIRDYLEEFVEILRRINKIFSSHFPNDKIDVVFLAHKQDLVGAISVRSILSKGVRKKIARLFPQINLRGYDTSIYMPSSLLRMFRDTILSKIIPVDSIEALIARLRDYAKAETVTLGDEMGLPIIFEGDLNMASWSSSFAARIIESLERERELSVDLVEEANKKLFKGNSDFRICLRLVLGQREIAVYIYNKDCRAVSLILVGPQNVSEATNDYMLEITERLFFKIHQGRYSYVDS